jgi:hypothetical protein
MKQVFSQNYIPLASGVLKIHRNELNNIVNSEIVVTTSSDCPFTYTCLELDLSNIHKKTQHLLIDYIIIYYVLTPNGIKRKIIIA